MLNMNEVNQGYLPDASAIVPAKRKRGRPRKYPRPDVDHIGSVYIPRVPNLSRGEDVHVPPGIVGANRNQHRQADPASNSNDSMIGQLVHGVVEAAFDAGYLLTVRVGDSDTMLRGLVFKPGRYVPLSAENDVAPGIPMIKRNEVPVPAGNYAQNAYPWTGERNGTSQVAQATDPIASRGKAKYNADVHPAPSGSSRGNVVPVVLQPVNVSNGTAASSQLASQLGASKGKELLDIVHSQNGATSMNQVLQFQPQSDHQVLHSGSQSGAVHHNPTEGLHGAESKPMTLPNMPFETLLTEVMKRVQVPSQSMETNSSSADKLSAKDAVGDAEDDDDGSDSVQALSVEPLQAVQPGFPVPPVVMSRPLESYGPGKMTELLQVLQENIAEKQAARTEEQAEGSSQT